MPDLAAAQRTDNLRRRMRNARVEGGASLDAYIVPSGDPHLSEYPPGAWARREFLTGFTGSAGDAVVTMRDAGLWTDSRYWLQAERQLDPDVWTLHRAGAPGVPSWQEHLARLGRGSNVGVDAALLSLASFESLAVALRRRGVALHRVEPNLIDMDWPDRPALPREPVRAQPAGLAGRSTADKLADLRAAFARADADAHLVTSLDAVAWLLNLRGGDVPFNPVFVAAAIITSDDATLYTELSRIPADVRESLAGAVRLEPYEVLEAHLSSLGPARRWWIDDAGTNARFAALLGDASAIVERGRSPVTLAKSRKNDVELEGIRAAHRRDGAAMVGFLRWLGPAVRAGGVDEWSAKEELERRRSSLDRAVGPSFATISSYGPNGAIIHYRVERESALPIGTDSIYLIDSGGQYLDGTTDITRSIHLGEPSAGQRDAFTRVLRGVISLSTLRFPEGTGGVQVDAFARRALWDAGLDYGHGTGHGVGAHLHVHEWPPSVSSKPAARAPLEPGMVLSNEPGHYRAGEFGIRIENLLAVERDPDRPGFLRFETLTLCPIQTSLVDVGMLSPGEREWLDRYHARVLESLAPLLDGQDRAWLERATAPLQGA